MGASGGETAAESIVEEMSESIRFWKLKGKAHDHIVTQYILGDVLPKWLFKQEKKIMPLITYKKHTAEVFARISSYVSESVFLKLKMFRKMLHASELRIVICH